MRLSASDWLGIVLLSCVALLAVFVAWGVAFGPKPPGEPRGMWGLAKSPSGVCYEVMYSGSVLGGGSQITKEIPCP